MHNPYYNEAWIRQAVENDNHRNAIGGMWEALGTLQLEFLKRQGLEPRHRLLDIGCGALRFGVKAVDYLSPGRYYGQDISADLIRAGYEKELSDPQRERLPEKNLAANGDFDFSFVAPEKIDMAIAQSVFSHLPLNHIRRCLAMLAPVMQAGGSFFATYWRCPDDHDITQPLTQPSPSGEDAPIITHDICDSYHYRLQDLVWCASALPWRVEEVGKWEHPRGQQMIQFIHAP